MKGARVGPLSKWKAGGIRGLGGAECLPTCRADTCSGVLKARSKTSALWPRTLWATYHAVHRATGLGFLQCVAPFPGTEAQPRVPLQDRGVHERGSSLLRTSQEGGRPERAGTASWPLDRWKKQEQGNRRAAAFMRCACCVCLQPPYSSPQRPGPYTKRSADWWLAASPGT